MFWTGEDSQNLNHPILQLMVRIYSKTLRWKNWIFSPPLFLPPPPSLSLFTNNKIKILENWGVWRLWEAQTHFVLMLLCIQRRFAWTCELCYAFWQKVQEFDHELYTILVVIKLRLFIFCLIQPKEEKLVKQDFGNISSINYWPEYYIPEWLVLIEKCFLFDLSPTCGVLIKG